MNDFHILAGRGAAACLTLTGVSKVLALEPMIERAHHLGFSVPEFRLIGVAELAGATGLVAGERNPHIGAAAAASLCAVMIGACTAHLRTGDRWLSAAPAAVVGVATAFTATGFVARVRAR
ncbi:DoxX family protein [Gordonia terrae]|uniref:DoxX family protein n=1 Tax=Gordonia terrae TaxID=2055 RepID=UPI003F6D0D1E